MDKIINIQDKVSFIHRYRKLADKAFLTDKINKYTLSSSDLNMYAEELGRLAYKELGYSEGYYYVDLVNTLRRAWQKVINDTQETKKTSQEN